MPFELPKKPKMQIAKPCSLIVLAWLSISVPNVSAQTASHGSPETSMAKVIYGPTPILTGTASAEANGQSSAQSVGEARGSIIMGNAEGATAAANSLYNEMLELCKHKYNIDDGKNVALPNGWEAKHIIPQEKVYGDCHPALYVKAGGPAVVVFRGTRIIEGGDDIKDLQMGQGHWTRNLGSAYEVGAWVAAAYNDRDVYFVGHSKGGVEAEFASSLTKVKAVVFDSPGLPVESIWVRRIMEVFASHGAASSSGDWDQNVLSVTAENDPVFLLAAADSAFERPKRLIIVKQLRDQRSFGGYTDHLDLNLLKYLSGDDILTIRQFLDLKPTASNRGASEEPFARDLGIDGTWYGDGGTILQISGEIFSIRHENPQRTVDGNALAWEGFEKDYGGTALSGRVTKRSGDRITILWAGGAVLNYFNQFPGVREPLTNEEHVRLTLLDNGRRLKWETLVGRGDIGTQSVGTTLEFYR